MKKTVKLAVVILLIVLLFAFAVLRRRHRLAKEARAQRDAAYGKVLSVYRQALHLGMIRSQVNSYLESHKLSYLPEGSDERQYDILIAEEPGEGFVCDRWNVYVALNFNTSLKAAEPSAADTLREIKIQKVGHCL